MIRVVKCVGSVISIGYCKAVKGILTSGILTKLGKKDGNERRSGTTENT